MRPARSLLLLFVSATTMLCAVVASAAGKVVVFHAEGDGADGLANEVRAALPKDFSGGDPDAFDAALATQGHKGPMSAALDKPEAREKLLQQVRKAAEGAFDAVIILRVKKPKKDRVVTVLVVDPRSPTVAREDEITLGPKRVEGEGKPVAASILPSLEKLLPPPEPEAKPAEAESAKSDAEAKPARETGDFATSLVAAAVGGESCFRSFSYNQGLTKNLRGYSVSGTPGFSAEVAAYPLASLGGQLAGLGVDAAYGQALGLQSAPANGQKIDTSWRRYQLGLRYRLKVGEGSSYVSPSLAYGRETFAFSGAPASLAGEVPAATYGFVRLAFDARVAVGPAALLVGGGYLFSSSLGSGVDTVGARFPHHNVGGVDLGLGVAYGFAKGFEARLSYRYRRFFYSMNPEPGEAYVAGGALDQLSSLVLGAAYAY